MRSDVRFFLGANSKDGFISYFEQLQSQNSPLRLLILKGGPGSGKSSLMKKLLSIAESKEHVTESIACASDPNSLDAVIDHTGAFAIMDGTAPHVQDPRIPGAEHHIFYTGDFWDTETLSENKKEIESVSREISFCHKSASAYIKAAATLLEENMKDTLDFLRRKEAISIAQEILSKLQGGDGKKTEKRLLSAISVGEIKLFSETPFHFADKVYVLEDPFGTASDFILKKIAFGAEIIGEKTIYCPCSVMPEKCDHLIFPDSRIAVVTQNKFMKFDGGEVISGLRLYNPVHCQEELIRRREDAAHLLSESCRLVRKAKNIHDDLEAFYVDAMDFRQSELAFINALKRFYN